MLIFAASLNQRTRANADNSQGRLRQFFVLLGILLIGLLPRLYLLVVSDFGIESDEAIVGLMAKHILQGRDWPVFYYGQHYMGSIEAFLTTLSFGVIGQGNAALKLAPLLFSLFLCLAVYALALRVTDRFGATIASLLTAVAPSTLILWSTKARGGFIELVFLGTLILILGIDFVEKDTAKRRRVFTLGLMAGLGWWMNNQVIFYLVPLAVLVPLVLIVRRQLLSQFGVLLLGLCAFVLGSLPFWYANILREPRWATFEVLFGKTAGSSLMQYVEGFLYTALPIIFGSRRFWSSSDIFPNASVLVYLLYGFCFLVALLTLVLRWLSCRSLSRRQQASLSASERPFSLILLFAFCLSVMFIFSSSRFGWLSQAPRYLLPLYSVIFVIVGAASSEIRKLPLPGACVAALVIPFTILGVHLSSCYYASTLSVGQPVVYQGERVAENHTALYSWLQAEKYDHIWTNYWIGYRTAFETDEKITFSRFGRPRSLRIPEYERNVTVSNKPEVYVLVDSEAKILAQQLGQFGYKFRQSKVSGYTIIDKLDRIWPKGKKIELSPEQLVVSSRDDWKAGAVDGDLSSRWGSGEPQKPGMYLEVLFSKPTEVASLTISFAEFKHDAPRHLVLEGRLSKGEWKTLADLGGSKIYYDLAQQEFAEIEPSWDIRFEPSSFTAIRLKQEASTQVFDWSIAELEMYGR